MATFAPAFVAVRKPFCLVLAWCVNAFGRSDSVRLAFECVRLIRSAWLVDRRGCSRIQKPKQARFDVLANRRFVAQVVVIVGVSVAVVVAACSRLFLTCHIGGWPQAVQAALA